MDLTGAHSIVFRVKGGEIRIEVPPGEPHLEVSGMGEGLPPLLISPDGGSNSVKLSLGVKRKAGYCVRCVDSIASDGKEGLCDECHRRVYGSATSGPDL